MKPSYILLGIVIIIIVSLCYYVEGFDIRSNNDIAGPSTITGDKNGNLSVTGDLNVTGDLSVGGKIIVGKGDSQWTIDAGMRDNWLNFYSNAPGSNKGKHVNNHGRVIMAPDGNIWSQPAGWTTEIKGIADHAKSHVDSIYNGGATIANLTVTGDLSAQKLFSRGGEMKIGDDYHGWTMRANGYRHKELEFWNNGDGKIRDHGRVLFGSDGNRWNDHVGWNTDVRHRINVVTNKLQSINDIQVGTHQIQNTGGGCCHDNLNNQTVYFPRHFSNDNIKVICVGVQGWDHNDIRHDNSTVTVRGRWHWGFQFNAHRFRWAGWGNMNDGGFHVEWIAIQF